MIMEFFDRSTFNPNTQSIAFPNNPSTSRPTSPNRNSLTRSSPNPTRKSSPDKSSRYENQKRRDWNTFCHYIKSRRPPLPLPLPHFNPSHILEFLQYLDQFGKTKVHNQMCPYFGVHSPPGSCPCPLRQAWGSLDALIGRLRAAYEENGGLLETNPFGARAVRVFLREVRDFQAKARGITYEKKRKRQKGTKSNNIMATTHE